MSGQSSDVAQLFKQRMQVVSRISQENAEHLRLVQLCSGNQVLSMKRPEAPEIDAARQDAEARLKACQQRLDSLEQELAEIDENIANATDKGDRNG